MNILGVSCGRRIGNSEVIRIEIIDDKLKFIFFDRKLQTPHFGPVGTKRHDDGLWQNQLLVDEKKQEMKVKLKKYKEYKSCAVPPSLKPK